MPPVHLNVYFLTGEYHHYDTEVYPTVIKVSKGWYDKAKTVFIKFFWPSTQTEGAKVVEFSPPSKEELVVRCLQFHLEPFRKMLLQDGQHPAGFTVDFVVSTIPHIFFLLHKQRVTGRQHTIPLAPTVSATL